jgi:exo-beta-1,3-glucanase (GH17 family)
MIALRKARFTGLVTYSAAGVLGKDLPVIAKSLGFERIIVGIWDPENQNEITNAIALSDNPIVLGFCVGNEGLDKRYVISDLSIIIKNLKEKTQKPVTTTEEIHDYHNKDLIQLGDWVFPNAHPYFQNIFDPKIASIWTENVYKDIINRSDKFVLFKEVGFPTLGDENGLMSEDIQDKYYQYLEKTHIQFVYFEAFDQPWKTHLPIEPYWGLFQHNRKPKIIAQRLIDRIIPSSSEK